MSYSYWRTERLILDAVDRRLLRNGVDVHYWAVGDLRRDVHGSRFLASVRSAATVALNVNASTCGDIAFASAATLDLPRSG
jgi:hypothetical protein